MSSTLRAEPARFAEGLSRQTLQFFLIAGLAVLGASGIAKLLMTIFPRAEYGSTLRFPSAFICSSLLLLQGSIALEKALGFLKLEKQAACRRWLLLSLLFGTLFMGVQTFALWQMFPKYRNPEQASLESTAFAMALAALHSLHFLVAVLFVSWVTVRTWANRYDHEYFWGMRFCAMFWHALGVVWVAILFVFLVASR